MNEDKAVEEESSAVATTELMQDEKNTEEQPAKSNEMRQEILQQLER